MSKTLLVISSFFLFTLPSLALGQEPSPSLMWNAAGTDDYVNLGAKLSRVGDLNGDGYNDILSMSPNANVFNFSTAGKIVALSGVDGSALWEYAGWQDNQNFGSYVTRPGDINGDGIDDFIVAEPEANYLALVQCGRITGISGANGGMLWQKYGASDYSELGRRIMSVGDTNNDGIRDLLLAQPMASTNGLSRNGVLELVSGNAYVSLWTVNGDRAGEMLGQNVKTVGDLNADGVGEVVSHAPSASTNGLYFNGCVTVLSMTNGARLWRVDGGTSLAHLGDVVANGIDCNGDGVEDLLSRSSIASVGGFFDNGALVSLSGVDGSQLWERSGPSHGSQMGAAFMVGSDINFDGVSDLIIGLPYEDANFQPNSGSIYAISAADGSTLYTANGIFPYGELGKSLRSVGDVNGDGFEDFLTGVDTAGTQGRVDNGYVQVHSGMNGMMLWLNSGTTSGERLGTVSINIPDVSGDGLADILVSSHMADSNGFGDNGKLTAMASNTGQILWMLSGSESQEMLGKELMAGGDIDGDGKFDVLAFSSRADTLGLRDNGMVKAISTADGSVIWRYDGGKDGDRIGESRLISYDHDMDGTTDVILGSTIASTNGMLNNGAVLALSAGQAMRFSVTNFISGSTAKFRVRGMLPGARAHYFGTLSGPGSTALTSGLTVALYQPITYLGSATVDATGQAVLSRRLPTGMSGAKAWMQASQNNLGDWSNTNMLQATFQ